LSLEIDANVFKQPLTGQALGVVEEQYAGGVSFIDDLISTSQVCSQYTGN
jgi:hypothetical protein